MGRAGREGGREGGRGKCELECERLTLPCAFYLKVRIEMGKGREEVEICVCRVREQNADFVIHPPSLPSSLPSSLPLDSASQATRGQQNLLLHRAGGEHPQHPFLHVSHSTFPLSRLSLKMKMNKKKYVRK